MRRSVRWLPVALLLASLALFVGLGVVGGSVATTFSIPTLMSRALLTHAPARGTMWLAIELPIPGGRGQGEGARGHRGGRPDASGGYADLRSGGGPCRRHVRPAQGAETGPTGVVERQRRGGSKPRRRRVLGPARSHAPTHPLCYGFRCFRNSKTRVVYAFRRIIGRPGKSSSIAARVSLSFSLCQKDP